MCLDAFEEAGRLYRSDPSSYPRPGLAAFLAECLRAHSEEHCLPLVVSDLVNDLEFCREQQRGIPAPSLVTRVYLRDQPALLASPGRIMDLHRCEYQWRLQWQ